MTKAPIFSSESQIYLLGSTVPESELKLFPEAVLGSHFDQGAGKKAINLGMISHFYYQNELLTLERPTIFAFSCAGHKLGGRGGKADASFNVQEVSRRVGEEMEWWLLDRADFTVRMDVAIGTAERLLLNPQFGAIDTSMMAGSGAEPNRRPNRPGRRGWRMHDDE